MVAVILIEPENPQNVGSIARVMANFDESELVLVNPQCKIDEDSRRLAKNAQHVLKKARIETLDCLSSYDLVIGTTSKLGTDYNIPRSPMTPKQMAEKLASLKGASVAIVLGRESDGLRNDEIEMCDFVVTIPTAKTYPSMNISHSLAILLYEMHEQELARAILSRYAPISAAEKRQLLKLLSERMQKMGFATDKKRKTQMKVWKRMISKSMMTRREAYALMGFLKKI